MNKYTRAYWGPHPDFNNQKDWFCADHWRAKCDEHEKEAVVNAHGLNVLISCRECGRSLAALANKLTIGAK